MQTRWIALLVIAVLAIVVTTPVAAAESLTVQSWWTVVAEWVGQFVTELIAGPFSDPSGQTSSQSIPCGDAQAGPMSDPGGFTCS